MPDTESKKKKRKIRWDRLFLTLLALILISVIAFGSFYLYKNTNFSKGPWSKYDNSINPDNKAYTRDLLTTRTNILLIGIDSSYSHDPNIKDRKADAIIVASIDPETASVNFISIPKETKVQIKNRIEPLNHTYTYGKEHLVKSCVEGLLKAPIHHYISLDFNGFVKVIDGIGGINIYVENDMNYEDPHTGFKINLKKGYQFLDGKKAIEYVCYCSDDLGEIGRMQRQQRFIKTVLKDSINLKTAIKIPNIHNIFKEHVVTDIPPWTMLKIANTLKSFSYRSNEIHSEMLPGKYVTIDGIIYWEHDETQTEALVNQLVYTIKDTTN
ncbi:LCP family protein [Selenomonadales bacterium OttesenSCG-928-I06]|nr:LCP family protein [Selenomonadales bacterium OttesenSCG-928-I06]